jgi:hypothetical protein
MRTEAEIKKKLKKLIEIKKAHEQEPEICPIGEEKPSYFTWLLEDYKYLNGEIDALKWILHQIENLAEEHT